LRCRLFFEQLSQSENPQQKIQLRFWI
jgi:hypothetical protein